MSPVSRSPRRPDARQPSGRSRLCCGRLDLVVAEDGLLPLPAHARFGLVPGAILALKRVSEAGLRLDNLRDFYLYPWQVHPRSLRDLYVDRFFARPLTHVAAEALAIPWEYFPLPAGTRVRLLAMDRKTGSVLYLWKTPQDP